MFAGENPDDVRARWLAMSQQMDFDVETIKVYFVPGRFKISELIERIRDEVRKLGGVSLLIIDTSAAYFEGDDENSNVQLGGHASGLRELSLPGGPTTIINCHPTKNATDDNLVPRDLHVPRRQRFCLWARRGWRRLPRGSGRQPGVQTRRHRREVALAR